MCDKQIYDINRRDLIDFPIWYFPMDDSVQDELTVRPIYDNFDFLKTNYQIILKSVFTDCEGNNFIGYIYWSDVGDINIVKPVLFVDDEECITFWNGMVEASWEGYSDKARMLRHNLPICYKSEFLGSENLLVGVLEGLYYIKDGNITFAK